MRDHYPYTNSYQNGELTVIDCEGCGFKHLWPIPTEADLHEIYREQFGGRVRPGFKERKKADEAYWSLAFARRLKSYEELLDTISPPRILDIGCGTGNLLLYFRDRGWEVHAIEPSKHFTEELAANGIPNIPKLTDEMSEQDWASLGLFHVVNMSMLLEHVRDPHGLLQEVVKLLLPRGILTIESPNDFNPLQVAAAEVHDLPMWWINRLHVNYFDYESLEGLVEQVGLTPVLREGQFPMELFLLFGDVYVGNSDLGRTMHLKRVAFESNLTRVGSADILQKIYRSLSELGVGRTAIVYSRKESE